MKALLPLLLTVLCASSLQAQKKTPAQVCNELLAVEVFVEYSKFKKDFEQTNRDLAPQLNQKDFDELNIAYNDVQKEYDRFLGIVQKDLQDYSAIKQIMKDHSVAVNTYSAAYQDVIDTYKKDYLPIYNRLNSSKSKALPPIIVALVGKAVEIIIDIIQKRKELNTEHISNILAVVNTNFFDKLRMKKWHELNLLPANANVNTAPNNYNFSGDKKRNSTTSSVSSYTPDATQQRAIANSTPVNPIIFQKIEGFVEFVALMADGKEERMDFAKKNGKDIVVASNRISNGQIQSIRSRFTTDFFTTEQSYAEGSQYFIKVNNSAGLYILTLNANNTVTILYPCAVDDSNPIPGYSSVVDDGDSKDIIIAKRSTNPISGQDINGFTVFPTPDYRTKPPTPNYFTVTGKSRTPENFCILLSKSVLDIELMKKQLEFATGTMDERLAKVFKADAMNYSEGRVATEDNKVTFDAADSDKSVLFLLFYIRR